MMLRGHLLLLAFAFFLSICRLAVAEEFDAECLADGAEGPRCAAPLRSEDELEAVEAAEAEALSVKLLQMRLSAPLAPNGPPKVQSEIDAAIKTGSGIMQLESLSPMRMPDDDRSSNSSEGVCWADSDCCPDEGEGDCEYFCQEGTEIDTHSMKGWEVKGTCALKWEGFCLEDEDCLTPDFICQRNKGMLAGTCTRDALCDAVKCGRGKCRAGSCTCDYGVTGEHCDRSTEAFAFLFYGNSSENLVSVRVLVRSMRAAGAPQDIIAIIPNNYVATTPKDYLDILESDGVKLYYTEPIPMPPSMDADPIIHKRWSGVMSKFAVWRMTNYSQVALLDTDMVFAFDSESPEAIFSECNAPLCAVRDGDSRFMNAGVMVVIPSRQRLAHIIHVLSNEQHHFAMPEQSFLTQYCKNEEFKMNLQFLDRKWNSCVGGGMLHNTGWESTGYNVLHSCSWTGKPPNMKMCFPGACDTNDQWHTVLVWQFFHMQVDPCIMHQEENTCHAAGLGTCAWCGHYCSNAKIPCSKSLFNQSRVRDTEEPDQNQAQSLWGQTKRVVGQGPAKNASAPWNRLPQGSWAWPQVAMYQILIDRFSSPSGEPCIKMDDYCGGSLKGIRQQIEYIEKLNVDGIVLSPIVTQMEHGYHGYWTKDLYGVNPQYGDEDDVKDLVVLFHERKMKVVVDVNLNHAGTSKLNVSNPADLAQLNPFNKPEHYHSDNCSLIHNSDYEKGALFVERCKLYGIPDYNQENPVVWQGLMHWVREHVDKYGFDGIRIDAAHHILRNFLRHIPEVGPPIPAFLEVVSGDMPFLLSYASGDYNAVYNYPLYYVLRDIFVSRKPMSLLSDWMTKEESSAVGRLLLNFLDNNDLPRFTFKLGEHSKLPEKTLTALYHNALLCIMGMEGVPVLLYGSEQGLKGKTNLSDVLKVDNWRPALWETGFNTSTPTFQMISKVLWLRHQMDGLHDLKQTPLYSDHQVVVFSRGQTIFVVSNAGQPSRIPSQRVLWANATNGYFQPYVVCNLLSVSPRSDCGVIAPGNISRLHITGDPKMYVPTEMVEKYEEYVREQMESLHLRRLRADGELDFRVLPYAEWNTMPKPPVTEIQVQKRTPRSWRPGNVALSTDTPEAWHAFPKLPPHLDRWSPPVGVPAPHVIHAKVEDACFYLGAGEKDGAIFTKREGKVYVLCPDSPEYCGDVVDNNINLQRLVQAAASAEVPSDALPVLHLSYDVWYGEYHTLVGALPSIVPHLPELRSGKMRVFLHADQRLALSVLTRLGVASAAFFPPGEAPLDAPYVFCTPKMRFDFATRPAFPRPEFSLQYLRQYREALLPHASLRRCAGGGNDGPVVLLSRGHSTSGALSNELELESALQTLGRPVIKLDTATDDLARTIEVLSTAAVIVGGHGSQMANILYAPEGVKVVEILPQVKVHIRDNHIWDLAGALNFTYVPVGERRRAELLELVPEEDSMILEEKATRSFEADPEKVKALVAALL